MMCYRGLLPTSLDELVLLLYHNANINSLEYEIVKYCLNNVNDSYYFWLSQ